MAGSSTEGLDEPLLSGDEAGYARERVIDAIKDRLAGINETLASLGVPALDVAAFDTDDFAGVSKEDLMDFYEVGLDEFSDLLLTLLFKYDAADEGDKDQIKGKINFAIAEFAKCITNFKDDLPDGRIDRDTTRKDLYLFSHRLAATLEVPEDEFQTVRKLDASHTFSHRNTEEKSFTHNGLYVTSKRICGKQYNPFKENQAEQILGDIFFGVKKDKKLLEIANTPQNAWFSTVQLPGAMVSGGSNNAVAKTKVESLLTALPNVHNLNGSHNIHKAALTAVQAVLDGRLPNIHCKSAKDRAAAVEECFLNYLSELTKLPELNTSADADSGIARVPYVTAAHCASTVEMQELHTAIKKELDQPIVQVEGETSRMAIEKCQHDAADGQSRGHVATKMTDINLMGYAGGRLGAAKHLLRNKGKMDSGLVFNLAAYPLLFFAGVMEMVLLPLRALWRDLIGEKYERDKVRSVKKACNALGINHFNIPIHASVPTSASGPVEENKYAKLIRNVDAQFDKESGFKQDKALRAKPCILKSMRFSIKDYAGMFYGGKYSNPKKRKKKFGGGGRLKIFRKLMKWFKEKIKAALGALGLSTDISHLKRQRGGFQDGFDAAASAAAAASASAAADADADAAASAASAQLSPAQATTPAQAAQEADSAMQILNAAMNRTGEQPTASTTTAVGPPRVEQPDCVGVASAGGSRTTFGHCLGKKRDIHYTGGHHATTSAVGRA